ncbi:hypothetical protein AAES_65733 [Amazona aestiva]|uniref:Uncharacterized protein n=1 Tax=Amazona aestiva TaxID=12930 RepID=A0A0Q3ML65_AMAAE|nr:hypothetical protein AAES_65733 [Amazona aestiva]
MMAQRGQPAPHAMAAKEELYSKVIPRRNRQHRAGTIKHGSSLEILLSMGFPKARAPDTTVRSQFKFTDEILRTKTRWRNS